MEPAWRIRAVPTVSSTNDHVRALAEAGEPEGIVVHALEQTGGRGRHGRSWASPKGNLYLSLLLRPKNLVPSLGWHSVLAALAVRDALVELLPNLDKLMVLKWPNDVLAVRQKMSGILLEVADNALICGIGINVHSKPDNPHYPTACLADFGYAGGVDEVRNSLLRAFGHWLLVYRTQGIALVKTAWLESALRGGMSVKLPSGEVVGSFDSIDDNACLLLRLADGTRRVISTGDVFPVGS